LDATSDIYLDAGGADIVLSDDGTTFGKLTNDSGKVVISGSAGVKIDTAHNFEWLVDGVGGGSYGHFKMGAGSDLQIAVLSDDVYIMNNTSNKDIVFQVNDGGSGAEVARFDGDVSAFKMASTNQLQFRDSGLYIYSSADGQLDLVADGKIVSNSQHNFDGGIKTGATFYVTGAVTGTGWGTGVGLLTASYSVLDDDNLRFFPVSASTSGASSMTITLPTVGDNAGRVLTFKDVAGNCDDNVITIDAEGSEKIDDELTIKLDSAYASVSVIAAGGSWRIF
jgi:hypothetical protein